MATQMMPEPSAARAPKPSQASEKMVGNMIELNNPIASSDPPASMPVVCADTNSSPSTAPAAQASTLPGENIRSSPAPMKRPTMAPPQYSGTCLPACSAARPSTLLCMR
jgi:hypothetical protein